MSDETKVTQEYGAEQIQVLEGLEAVRKRPYTTDSSREVPRNFPCIIIQSPPYPTPSQVWRN